MSRQADKLGDAILSVIDTAEQNDVSYDEMLEQLESAAEMVREWKAEREAKDERRNPPKDE